MDTQTESSTPTDSHDYLLVCQRVCNHQDQPMFVLHAQDITADLAVDFWTIVQLRVREHMNAGLTLVQAVAEIAQVQLAWDASNSTKEERKTVNDHKDLAMQRLNPKKKK